MISDRRSVPPQLGDFLFNLDHIVIFSAVDAPEAKTLETLGLQGWGGVTRHGDLGTASTSFFFENTYLELFWAENDVQAMKTTGQTIGLDVIGRRQWRETGMSPFGVMLYRQTPSALFPFPTKRLHANWMPGEVYVEFAGEQAGEPYYGIVPQMLSYNSFKANIPGFSHPLGMKQLTGLHITITETPSAIARWISQASIATIECGPEPLMRLTFDDGIQGKMSDIRPTLPLILKY